MAFPSDPLGIYVDIAPGASPEASVDTWDTQWVDITDDVRASQGITVEEGIPDEANQADPSTCALVLNNRSGNYSPRNPLGTWFGKLAKNTPLRVRLERGKDTFARTIALGSGWGTSDSGIVWTGTTGMGVDGTRGYMGSGSITTDVTDAGGWDFEMTTGIAVDILPGVGNYKVFAISFRRNGTANSLYQLRFDFNPDNTISMYVQRRLDGATVTLYSAVQTGLSPAVANTQYSVRLKAEGGFIAGKIWKASTAEPASWTYSTSVQGDYTLDNTTLGTGMQILCAQIGTPATTKAYWYPITINAYPFLGTVPEWPVRWDQSGKDSTVTLKAAGVLRRLQQGATPLRSPLYSYVDSLSPTAAWMMEDESGATQAAAATPNTSGAYVYSSSPGGWNGVSLGGTSSQYNVATDTTISGVIPRMNPASAWTAWFFFYMPVLPVTNPTIFRVRSSGTVVEWNFKVSDDFGGVVYLLGLSSDGTTLINHSLTYTPGRWVLGLMEITQVGSTITSKIGRYDLSAGSGLVTTSAAISGNIGSPQGWSIFGQTGFQDGAVGPVAFFPKALTVSTSELVSASTGFQGEDAGARIKRLAGERNVKIDMISGAGTTPMGTQTAGTFLNVVNEAAVTDAGLLTEFRGGLRYRTRQRRYNQTARMTLDFNSGHISEPPEPTDDDQRIRNDVTVTRKNGGSARAFDSVSIAVNGSYDTSVEINPASDADLLAQAMFRLYLGTWDEIRWPSITIDLARNASASGFLEKMNTVEPGAYVMVTNPPSNLPVGTLHLLVESIEHTFDPYEWKMELTCSPYGPWRIPKTGVSTPPRMDLVGSTLGSAEAASTVGATDTWTITNTGNAWNSAAVPFNWTVGGEVVTVTALSGTSSQTATVTRGVNGIVKAHAVGEEVHLERRFYVAL